MKELDYLKDMLCTEVKKITQQNDFTTSTLETAYKIVDMLKDIEEIQEKESHQYEKDGSYGYWESDMADECRTMTDIPMATME